MPTETSLLVSYCKVFLFLQSSHKNDNKMLVVEEIVEFGPSTVKLKVLLILKENNMAAMLVC